MEEVREKNEAAQKKAKSVQNCTLFGKTGGGDMERNKKREDFLKKGGFFGENQEKTSKKQSLRETYKKSQILVLVAKFGETAKDNLVK